jgi:hypothetical protein
MIAFVYSLYPKITWPMPPPFISVYPVKGKEMTFVNATALIVTNKKNGDLLQSPAQGFDFTSRIS